MARRRGAGPGKLDSSTFIRALRLLRMIKADEYVEAFDDYVRIIGQNAQASCRGHSFAPTST